MRSARAAARARAPRARRPSIGLAARGRSRGLLAALLAAACGGRERDPPREVPAPVPVAGPADVGGRAPPAGPAGADRGARGAADNARPPGAARGAPPAGPSSPAAAGAWPELVGLPRTEPTRVIALPARPDVPRFAVGGPALAGDLAVVASSQFGFLAVDFRRGAIAWSRPAGLYVAPPAIVPDGIALVSDCFAPPPPEALGGQRLLGCLRVVSRAGTDLGYLPIRGAPAAVEAFAAAPGAQALWRDGDAALRWRRGDRAVRIDLYSGIAVAAPALPPPLPVVYGARRWEIALDGDGRVVATTPPAAPARRGGPVPRGRSAWRSDARYSALLGIVWLPESSPMLRLASLGRDGRPGVRITDMDATGSLATASARPMPGVALLGASTSSVGDAALAIRLDSSLRRDFIAGFAANAMVMWVYPLPDQPRADPVGVAVAPDAVIAFHDGDTLTVLPELSAPPTAPGAARAPLENPPP
jgi:hypothetical protein